MKGLLTAVSIFFLTCFLAPTDLLQQTTQQCLQTTPGDTRSQEQLAREIRHELIALPHYSIFDNLDFRIGGTGVTLLGQVTSPKIKADAAAAVKTLGITSITDQIESLPVSPTDDELRLQLFRVIYSSPTLEKYAIQAVPPIHIIVKNGHVTLVGTVAAQVEKNQAELEASALPGVILLKNNLRVEKQAAA